MDKNDMINACREAAKEKIKGLFSVMQTSSATGAHDTECMDRFKKGIESVRKALALAEQTIKNL